MRAPALRPTSNGSGLPKVATGELVSKLTPVVGLDAVTTADSVPLPASAVAAWWPAAPSFTVGLPVAVVEDEVDGPPAAFVELGDATACRAAVPGLGVPGGAELADDAEPGAAPGAATPGALVDPEVGPTPAAAPIAGSTAGGLGSNQLGSDGLIKTWACRRSSARARPSWWSLKMTELRRPRPAGLPDASRSWTR